VNNTGASEDHEVRLASVDGGENRFLLRARSSAVYASGYLAFMRESALMVQRFDADALELSGEAFPLLDGVEHIGAASRGVFAFSGVGTLIYQPATGIDEGELVWVDREGRELGRLGEPGPSAKDLTTSTSRAWQVRKKSGSCWPANRIRNRSTGPGTAASWSLAARAISWPCPWQAMPSLLL
jgi:hypothetical protein